MKHALVLSLVFLLVGCNGKKKEIALAWENELKEKREKGIPVKCPFCKGWGYILEDESNDDPIYCIWKGQLDGKYLDSDNLWWDSKTAADGSDYSNPVTIDEESSWRGFLFDWDYGMKSGDTLETAMARLGSKDSYTMSDPYCYSQFTYNHSLDKWDTDKIRTKQFWKKFEEDLKKSPEQIELEKITKELKELRKEAKRKK